MLKINSILFCCSFYLFFFLFSVRGNQAKLPRYVIETDLKPAIFGSYSYDMVHGEFVIRNDNSSTTEINLTDIIFHNTSSFSIFDDKYRKHVATRPAPTTMKTFNWWTQTRDFLENTTLYEHINQNKTVTPLS